MSTNPFLNTRVEFHILQSFPVTCLNRDDVGSPKTAVVGGVTRARVSSQCWKRQVRMMLHELGVKIGTRSKLVNQQIAAKCRELGAMAEQAQACGDVIAKAIVKDTFTSSLTQKSRNLPSTHSRKTLMRELFRIRIFRNFQRKC